MLAFQRAFTARDHALQEERNLENKATAKTNDRDLPLKQGCAVGAVIDGLDDQGGDAMG